MKRPPDEQKQAPLERYFSILEILCGSADGLSLGEVAILLGLPKQSAHRLLANLLSANLVELKGARKQSYGISPRIQRLAVLSTSDELVETLTRNILKRCCDEVSETTYLARLRGTTIQSVAMESPDTPWRGFVLPGKELQPHATASGKAIMAFQPEEVVERVLAGRLPKLTANTLATKAALKADYRLIRQRGFATCIGEVDENLAAVAVPIDIPSVGVSFSLGLVGPLQRICRLIKSDVHVRMVAHANSIALALSMNQNRAAQTEAVGSIIT